MDPYYPNHNYHPYYGVSNQIGAQVTTSGLVVGVVLGAVAVVGLAYFVFLKDVFHYSGMELQRRG